MLGLKIHDGAEFGAAIIRKVRESGALSRVELARELGVAASTIGRHMDTLVADGYLLETLEPTREAGRPPTRLRPNNKSGCFLGVDFHSTQLYATAVDFAQNTILQKSFPINGELGVDSILNEVSNVLLKMQSEVGMPVLAVGLAIPGRVDTQNGVGLLWTHCPGWKDVPVAATIYEIIHAPVFVENNIRTMALAERWFGEPIGCQHLICLGVRVGVSAGIIRNGQLATGYRELGGEIRGWSCPVFNAIEEKWEWITGATIEKQASVPAIVARYATLSGLQNLTVEDLITAVGMEDKHALAALREGAAVHGWAISQMVQLIDPEIVVLAGPLARLGSTYLDAVTNVALQYESDYHPSVPIRVSGLGDHAGSFGAAALALEKWRPEHVQS